MINEIMYNLAAEATKSIQFRDHGKIVSYFDNPRQWGEYIERAFCFRLDKEAKEKGIPVVQYFKQRTVYYHNFSVRLLDVVQTYVPEGSFVSMSSLDQVTKEKIEPQCEIESTNMKFLWDGHPNLIIPHDFDIRSYDNSMNNQDKLTYAALICSEQDLLNKLLISCFQIFYKVPDYLQEIHRTGEKKPAGFLYAALLYQIMRFYGSVKMPY